MPSPVMKKTMPQSTTETSLTSLQYAAEGGHPVAQWKLGRMYADGDGVAQPAGGADGQRVAPHGAEDPVVAILERRADIVGARQIVPEGVVARHPAFDVTPARLVSALFTELGVAEPPLPAAIGRLARALPAL